MRLLHTKGLKLSSFSDANLPKYAILSHTWGPSEEEVLYDDVKNKPQLTWSWKRQSEKIRMSCQEAHGLGYEWIWIDTVCINKTSSAELSEALNSMFNWYQGAGICIAYLDDVYKQNDIPNARWFTRGWTLQELIAPSSLRFYSASWSLLGTRYELASTIERMTGIDSSCLARHNSDGIFDLRSFLDNFTVSQRMVWARGRQTKRIEDRAYSLMGIFDVNMPLLYGEGEKAFVRLQREIIKTTNDHSILAHEGCFWAEDPDSFLPMLRSPGNTRTTALSANSLGVQLNLLIGPCFLQSKSYSLGILDGIDPEDHISRVAILLDRVDKICYRRVGNSLWHLSPSEHGKAIPHRRRIRSTDASVADDGRRRGHRVQVDINLDACIRKDALILHKKTLSFYPRVERFVVFKISTMSGHENYEIASSSPEIKNDLIVGKPMEISHPMSENIGSPVGLMTTPQSIGEITFRDKSGHEALLSFGIAAESRMPWCRFLTRSELAEIVAGIGPSQERLSQDTENTDFSSSQRSLHPVDIRSHWLNRSPEASITFGTKHTMIEASVMRTNFLGNDIYELSISEIPATGESDEYPSQAEVGKKRKRRNSDDARRREGSVTAWT